MMYEYQLVIFGAILCMAVIALVNLLTFRALSPKRKPMRTPFVSVLIPARNEAENIGVCLSGLVAQDYPRYEIVVLDDGSNDGTEGIVRDWEQSTDKVRYRKGEPLPAGWVGKCFACHQLSQIARGDLLLFTDADTMHSRFSLSAAVATMEKSKADLLTVIPFLTLRSFWEKSIMPMLHFTTFCFLPIPLVRLSRNPKFAMANGQFMLFKRSVYEAIGGHEAVKDALVEDVWLSRLVKRKGYALRIKDGVRTVSTRMYRSFGEIWHGFSKNLFPGFRYSIGAMSAVMAFNIATSILPFLFLAETLVTNQTYAWTSLVFAQVGLILLIRLVLAHRFKLNLLAVLTHPVGMAVVVGIAYNSVRWAWLSGGMRWKGRTYKYNLRTDD